MTMIVWRRSGLVSRALVSEALMIPERAVERFLSQKSQHQCGWLETDGIALIGSILCGHDGRQGCLYHVCVKDGFIQTAMALGVRLW